MSLPQLSCPCLTREERSQRPLMAESMSYRQRWMPRQVIGETLIKTSMKKLLFLDNYGIKVRKYFAFSDKNSSVRLLNKKGWVIAKQSVGQVPRTKCSVSICVWLLTGCFYLEAVLDVPFPWLEHCSLAVWHPHLQNRWLWWDPLCHRSRLRGTFLCKTEWQSRRWRT